MAESAPTRLIDSCNRHLNYLRVSITDRCNLSCMYCLPQESLPRLSHEDILRYEEILRIVAEEYTIPGLCTAILDHYRSRRDTAP